MAAKQFINEITEAQNEKLTHKNINNVYIESLTGGNRAIIITSEVVIDTTKWQEALALAKSHVEASRREAGCISHRYLISPEKDNCIFFFEKWVDRAAIDFHFRQSYARHLSKIFQAWATSEVKINFHKVEDKAIPAS